MQGKTLTLKNGVEVWICQSCLDGEHWTYGWDHRAGEVDRRDCKNLTDDGRHQCACNPDWPELMEVILEPEDSKEGAEKSAHEIHT